jgi:hypothetical protein
MIELFEHPHKEGEQLIILSTELKLLIHIAEEQKKIMADITALAQAVSDLSTASAADDASIIASLAAIQTLISTLQAGVGPTQAQIDALTSAVTGVTASINADASKVAAVVPAAPVATPAS